MTTFLVMLYLDIYILFTLYPAALALQYYTKVIIPKSTEVLKTNTTSFYCGSCM